MSNVVMLSDSETLEKGWCSVKNVLKVLLTKGWVVVYRFLAQSTLVCLKLLYNVILRLLFFMKIKGFFRKYNYCIVPHGPTPEIKKNSVIPSKSSAL